MSEQMAGAESLGLVLTLASVLVVMSPLYFDEIVEVGGIIQNLIEYDDKATPAGVADKTFVKIVDGKKYTVKLEVKREGPKYPTF
jgi:hypothetical protein